MNIDINQLAKVVEAKLYEWNEDISEAVNLETKKVAMECAKELKSTSPKDSGDYAKDWAVKTEKSGKNNIQCIVHNRNHYQLTHLLENGHANRNGGRTEGQPHIEPAERKMMVEFEKRVIQDIKGVNQ